MEQYTFRDYTLTRLDKDFGLQKVFSSHVLDQWLLAEFEINDLEKLMLRSFQQLLLLNIDAWNEQELSMHFIGPMLGLTQFTVPYRFNLFAERKIGAILPSIHGDIELSGRPDGIIATGYREPEIPMFAFSKYKRQLDPDGDPAAQTLGAMLVGQILNENDHPIYGAYVIGSAWRFMTLEGSYYRISREYSALTDEIFDILRILKSLKEIVMALTA